jgi:hypothetical protein
MKKTILIMMALVACLTVTSVAGAATLIQGPAGTSIGGSSFVPSTNVGISALSTINAYCAVAQNSSSDKNKGGKQYATTSGASTLTVADSLSDSTTPTPQGTPCTTTAATPF